MKLHQTMIALGFLLLVVIAAVGLLLTDTLEQAAFYSNGPGRAPRLLVDEEPVLTARALAHFAATPDERVDAEEALQTADDEVESAFSDALRDAQQHPVALTAEGRVLAARVRKSEDSVADDQERVDVLSKQLGRARDAEKDSLQSQLGVVSAQLELDQDELQDAKQDLLRATGDPSRIVQRLQHQMDRHKLFEQQGLEAGGAGADNSDAGYDAKNLVAQMEAWFALTRKATLLQTAIEGTRGMQNRLVQMHDALEARAKAVLRPIDPPRGKPPVAAPPHFAGADPQALADLTKRMADEEDLDATYSDWLGFVVSRQRVAQGGIIRSLLWIMLIIPSVLLVGRGVGHFLVGASSKRPHLTRLNGILQFALQAAGVLLVVIIILGFPQHVPEAIFGLVGAGVTVALKEFSGNYLDNRIRGIIGGALKQDASGGQLT